MSHDVFYIASIIAVFRTFADHQFITFYVTTNADTSAYTPAFGDLLPAMAVKFMEKFENPVLLAPNVYGYFQCFAGSAPFNAGVSNG